jgi:hypothetical protein
LKVRTAWAPQEKPKSTDVWPSTPVNARPTSALTGAGRPRTIDAKTIRVDAAIEQDAATELRGEEP